MLERMRWRLTMGYAGIFALILLGIFYPVLKQRWEQKRKAEIEAVVAQKPVIEREKRATRLSDVVFTSTIIFGLALALWQSRDFGYRAGLFPWVIGTPVVALAIVQLILELTGKVKRTLGGEGEAAPDLTQEVVYRRSLSIIGWLVGFLIAIWLLGFLYAIPVAMVLYLKFTGGEKWATTLILTSVTWAFFYGLFDYSLSIPFPEGQLFIWLS
jgi:hypothetical protein